MSADEKEDREEAEDTGQGDDAGKNEGDAPKDRPHHFLVVDDDPDSRKTVADYLKQIGYNKVTQAQDGAEALRLIEYDSSITFIISDWDMPLMDGFTLLQRVRANPYRSNLPFLIMTSPVSQETEKVLMAAENLVDAYVIKPFRIKRFQEKIDDVLKQTVHGPQKQVVVVDDDSDALEMVKEYLKKFGFKEVVGYTESPKALEYIRSNQNKLGMIIADWEMPDLSGLDLLKTIKNDPILSKIPFLMITSQSSLERVKISQAAQNRVDQYLLKPFRSDQLRSRIESIINRSNSQGEIEKLLAVGKKHAEAGQYRAAQEVFLQVLQMDGTNFLALRYMGDVQIMLSGVANAMPYYKQAVDANPYNVTSYIKLSLAYEQSSLIEKAIALLKVANKQIGFSAELHFRLGELYLKRNMNVEAMQEFEKTLELDIDHEEAKIILKKMKNKSKDKK